MEGSAPLPSTYFRPRESERGVYTEKKLGAGLLALWETTDLPADARVVHVTLIPYRGERVVVPRRDGRLSLPEGDVTDAEPVEAAIHRIALDQAGIAELTSKHLGHFRCRATSANNQLPLDTIVYDALYGVEVTALADFPGDRANERRIILQRDLNELLRSSYIERRLEYTDALDRWLLARLKAQT